MRVPHAPLLLATLVLAGCLAPVPGAPVASVTGAFGQLLCPFSTPDRDHPLERCNVRATAQTGPANEIDLAMDPSDPRHLVIVAKAYNETRLLGRLGGLPSAGPSFGLVPQDITGPVITVTAASFDGGLTWHEGYLQPFEALLPVPAPVVEDLGHAPVPESDPVVTFASDGAVLAMALRVAFPDGGLPVYRSIDGGRTFAEDAEAYHGLTDKNWMRADPRSDWVYAVTRGGSQAACTQGGSAERFLRSPDGGRTWEDRGTICSGALASLAIGPSGEVWVAGYAEGKGLITALRSSDHGETWSAPTVVAPLARPSVATFQQYRLFRTTNLPQIAVSPVDGTPYVVWANQSSPSFQAPCVAGSTCLATPDHDVFLSRSTDGGASWTPPMRINDDPDSDFAFQFNPQIAVGPAGDVHVAWFDQRADPTGVLAEVFYAHSADGLAWDPNLRVTDQPFVTTLSTHQDLQQLAFLGEYIGLQASADRAVIAFPDTRYGRADVFVATIR